MRAYRDFTPLCGSPDRMRAARMYPGGRHLDEVVGRKPEPEPGWHYPEAWIFSPEPAVNPGSRRTGEGQTLVCDEAGEEAPWPDYARRFGEAVLGAGRLDLAVKLLDADSTLPKEFHFRPEDESALRAYPRLKAFRGTLIKPEVWIRHPSGLDSAKPAWIGFNRRMSPESLLVYVNRGVDALESVMNPVELEPAQGLFLPGGTVHSLGRGLYFEILAPGDLKVTLQDRFAGRALSIKQRLDGLYTGRPDDLRRALDFIDYGTHGPAAVQRARCSYRPASGRTTFVRTPWFSADWIRLESGERLALDSGGPHVLVAASGRTELSTARSRATLVPRASSPEAYRIDRTCCAAVVHAETRGYTLFNGRPETAMILAARSAPT